MLFRHAVFWQPRHKDHKRHGQQGSNPGDGSQTANPPPLPGTPGRAEVDEMWQREPRTPQTPLKDNSSIRSRVSNRSAQSRASRGSAVSFDSTLSRFSRRSRLSRSSQRSYDNPVLDALQTMLDRVTEMQAMNKPTIFRPMRRRKIRERETGAAVRSGYFRAVLRLSDQLGWYVVHPAVVHSTLHVAPMGMYGPDAPPLLGTRQTLIHLATSRTGHVMR
jgi:hypothetical protein